MTEIVRETVDGARTTADPEPDPGGIPERPSLVRRSMSGLDASEDVGDLDRELDTLPPGAPETPALILRLAIAHRDAGDEHSMKDAMLRLIRNYPMSELVPHVYVVFGDFYREQNNFDNALKLYGKATQFHDSRMAGLAHYLTAWCRLQQTPSDPARALESFVHALRLASKGLASEHDGFVSSALVDAALTDLTAAYFKAGRPSRFVDFFVRLAPDDAERRTVAAATRLGTAYEAAGQTADSVALCTGLTARFADVEAPCPWQ